MEDNILIPGTTDEQTTQTFDDCLPNSTEFYIRVNNSKVKLQIEINNEVPINKPKNFFSRLFSKN